MSSSKPIDISSMAMPSLMHDSRTSAETVAAISNVMHTIVSWVCDTALLSEVRGVVYSPHLTLAVPALFDAESNHDSVLVRAESVVELAPRVRPLGVAEGRLLAGLRVHALEDSNRFLGLRGRCA